MERASAVDFGAEFVGCSAGVFRVSAEADRGDYTAGIAASNRWTFSTFSCVISFWSKAVSFLYWVF
jgi:hypothetical protein